MKNAARTLFVRMLPRYFSNVNSKFRKYAIFYPGIDSFLDRRFTIYAWKDVISSLKGLVDSDALGEKKIIASYLIKA